jgi:MFS family permease
VTPKSARIFTRRYASIMFADVLQRICTAMLMALLPLYVVEMGYSKTVAGLTTTVYMLVAVVFRPVVGKLVDTKGRYMSVIIGATVFLFASGFFSLAMPVGVFLGMRGLQGLGFCFIGTALMTMATDIIPRNRMSEGIGYLGLTGTLARAFFPWVALALKDAYGYRVTYMVIFGIAFLDLIAASTLRWARGHADEGGAAASTGILATPADASSLPAPNKVKRPLWERLVDREALRPSVVMLVVMFSTSCLQTFVVVYAIARGIKNPGMFFVASSVAVAAARLCVGRLSQRFGSVAVLAPGLVLTSVSMLIMFWLDNTLILVLSGVLSGLGMGMVQPELNSLAVLLAREERRGLANSTFFMAMDLGGAAGAVVLGAMADYAGLGSIFLTGAGLALVGFLGYLYMHRKGLFSLRSPEATLLARLPARRL